MIPEAPAGSISFGKRIDFHTHILPEMDDGSESVEMSIRMIRTLHKEGTVGIVLTPHFYPSRDNPKHFLRKRAAKFELLRSGFKQSIPLLLAGAEVHYFEGISAMRELPEMRIEKSRALMIEMPMCEWSNRMVNDIAELNRQKEYQVILAHAERYLGFGNLLSVRQLAASGVTVQISADAFSGYFRARKTLELLDEGLVHILGSDCHDMDSRAPNLAAAYEYIERKRGESAVRAIIQNGLRLLAAPDADSKMASKAALT